jgi:hypothetical protein
LSFAMAFSRWAVVYKKNVKNDERVWDVEVETFHGSLPFRGCFQCAQHALMSRKILCGFIICRPNIKTKKFSWKLSYHSSAHISTSPLHTLRHLLPYSLTLSLSLCQRNETNEINQLGEFLMVYHKFPCQMENFGSPFGSLWYSRFGTLNRCHLSGGWSESQSHRNSILCPSGRCFVSCFGYWNRRRSLCRIIELWISIGVFCVLFSSLVSCLDSEPKWLFVVPFDWSVKLWKLQTTKRLMFDLGRKRAMIQTQQQLSKERFTVFLWLLRW